MLPERRESQSFIKGREPVGGASGKEPACQYRRGKRRGFHAWVGKIPCGGHGNPPRYSCLENPMDRGAWRPTAFQVTIVGHSLATKPTNLYIFIFLSIMAWHRILTVVPCAPQQGLAAHPSCVKWLVSGNPKPSFHPSLSSLSSYHHSPSGPSPGPTSHVSTSVGLNSASSSPHSLSTPIQGGHSLSPELKPQPPNWDPFLIHSSTFYTELTKSYLYITSPVAQQ